jgi:hypothetical protein
MGFMSVSRPAVLPCTAARRCAPAVARMGDDENRIDISDTGDECVITPQGASCLEADIAGSSLGYNGMDMDAPGYITHEPLDVDQTGSYEMDGLNPPDNEEERRRRSPGMVNDFTSVSPEDFRKSWTEPVPEHARVIRPVNRPQSAQGPRDAGVPKFDDFTSVSSDDFRKSWTEPAPEHARVIRPVNRPQPAQGPRDAGIPKFGGWDMPNHFDVY